MPPFQGQVNVSGLIKYSREHIYSLLTLISVRRDGVLKDQAKLKHHTQFALIKELQVLEMIPRYLCLKKKFEG